MNVERAWREVGWQVRWREETSHRIVSIAVYCVVLAESGSELPSDGTRAHAHLLCQL